MMRRALLLSLGLLAAIGCGGEPPVPAGVVVTMHGLELSYEQFTLYVAEAVGESEVAMSSEVLSGLFDQYLDEIVLRRWAEEEGIAATAPSSDALLALLSHLPTREPTAAEVEGYFRAHREEFRLSERVRLRQILVDDVDDARRAQAELRAGREFAEVADRFARHAFTPPGGDQGLLAREDLPAAFEEIVFELDEGERSDIIATDYGFYLFKVTERLPARDVGLDEARPEITRLLRRTAADAELAELVEQARTRYNARVHRENLPFDYDGRYLNDRLPDKGPDDADD
jgi:peptidyl-prolyl cis-trans isomerase C/foldase protein PrsA